LIRVSARVCTASWDSDERRSMFFVSAELTCGAPSGAQFNGVIKIIMVSASQRAPRWAQVRFIKLGNGVYKS